MKLIGCVIKIEKNLLCKKLLALSLFLSISSAQIHADVFNDIGKFVTQPPPKQARDVAQFAKKVGMTVKQAEIALTKTTESIIDTVDAISNLVNISKKAVADIKGAVAVISHARSSQEVIDPVFTFTKAPLAIHTQALEVMVRLLDSIFTFSKQIVRPFDEEAHRKLTYNFFLPTFNVITKIDTVTQKISRSVNILETASRNINTHSLNIINYVKQSPLSSKRY